MSKFSNGKDPQTMIQQILQRAKEVKVEQTDDTSKTNADKTPDTSQETSPQPSVRPKIKVWIEDNGKPEFVPKHVRDSCLTVKQTLDASTADAVTAIKDELKKFRCKENRTAIPNILMYVAFIMLVWLLMFFGITVAYNVVLIHNAKLMQVIWLVAAGMVGSILMALVIYYKTHTP